MKVFISHGKADSWLADRIARAIRDEGAVTFLDENDISKGDDFKMRIHKEVAACDELVALFTPWTAQRFWVWLKWARHGGKGNG